MAQWNDPMSVNVRPSLVAQQVKNLPANAGDVWSLGQEDSLEKQMAIHSSIFAWEIPWTEELGGLQFMESQRVRHGWATKQQTTVNVSLYSGEEKEIATHSSILAWRIPWTGEPGGPQSVGSQSQTWLSTQQTQSGECRGKRHPRPGCIKVFSILEIPNKCLLR